MKKETLISCRSAFILYKEKGIEAVAYEFPDCVDFVNENKDLSVEEVTELLSKELDKL